VLQGNLRMRVDDALGPSSWQSAEHAERMIKRPGHSHRVTDAIGLYAPGNEQRPHPFDVEKGTISAGLWTDVASAHATLS